MSNLTVIDAGNQNAAKVEQAFIQGDLSVLSDVERLQYYLKVCGSLELNPATRPLEFIKLNGKLVLYARKDCTDQLRTIRGVSVVGKPDIQVQDGLCIVSVMLQDRHGRTDSDIGITVLGQLQGEAKANAIMKAVTKAKRRATLSLCGLGILDESELDTVADYKPVEMDLTTGAILNTETDQATVTVAAQPSAEDARLRFEEKAVEYGFHGTTRKHFGELAILCLKGKPAKWDADAWTKAAAVPEPQMTEYISYLHDEWSKEQPAPELTIIDVPAQTVTKTDPTLGAMAR